MIISDMRPNMLMRLNRRSRIPREFLFCIHVLILRLLQIGSNTHAMLFEESNIFVIATLQESLYGVLRKRIHLSRSTSITDGAHVAIAVYLCLKCIIARSTTEFASDVVSRADRFSINTNNASNNYVIFVLIDVNNYLEK